MNKNVYLNIVATVLLLCVLIIGLALIYSVDLMRKRTEQVSRIFKASFIQFIEKTFKDKKLQHPIK